MTTFDTQQPYLGDSGEQPQRTSGMAVTALVLSILGIIPCCGALTAGIGVILGIVGMVTIGTDPRVKGRGMSAAAVIIGVIFLVIQVIAGVWLYRTLSEPIMQGPAPALRAGFAGDANGFRDAFYGPGATAGDDEVDAFIEELRQRYGDFVSAEFVGDAGAAAGQPVFTGQYRLTFANAVVDAEADIIIADEDTGEIFIMKLESMRIFDADRGDLEFPPPQAAAPPEPPDQP